MSSICKLVDEKEEEDDLEDQVEMEDDDNQEEDQDLEKEEEEDQEDLEEEEKEKPDVEGKNRRISFELPAGFLVLKKGTKRRSWKEYLSPDGIYILVETFRLSNHCRKEISVSRRHQERLRE